jgi:methionyl-tRNA formyltransferase
MRVCILTSNKPRHRYMANRIMERFNVVGLFSEAKQPKRHIAEKVAIQEVEGAAEIASYLSGFIAAEQKYLMPFGAEFRILPNVPCYKIAPDRLNEPELINTIRALRPDCFAVFGTSLVRRDLMSLSPYFVNIHLGLSPYYRGVATSFWPFYNGEPEYNGVTVFYLDEGIDSGSVIHQALVDVAPGDFIHDLSVKAIISGVDLQLQALQEIEDGSVVEHPQDLSVGKVYYNKDFDVHALRKVLGEWDSERIEEYRLAQDERKRAVEYIR